MQKLVSQTSSILTNWIWLSFSWSYFTIKRSKSFHNDDLKGSLDSTVVTATNFQFNVQAHHKIGFRQYIFIQHKLSV